MSTEWHFPVMIAASLIEFVLVLWLVVGRATLVERRVAVAIVAVVVVVFGMAFGKFGAALGLPWWIYYPVPALITVALPPLVFRLSARRTFAYLGLALLSAPLIHVLFSFFLGWHEYMPFLPIPSIAELS
jgi:hypothetical protein